MITLLFECGGCFKKEPGKDQTPGDRMKIDWLRFPTRQDIIRITPEGWMTFDPYTNATYCPECWKGIESDSA